MLAGHKLAEDPEIIVWTHNFSAALKALHNLQFYSKELCKAWTRLADTQSELVRTYAVIYEPIGDETTQSAVETPQRQLDRVHTAVDRLSPVAGTIQALANEQASKFREHTEYASENLKNIERLLTKRAHKKIDYERCLSTYEREKQKAPENITKAQRDLEAGRSMFLKYDDLVKQRIPDFLAMFDTFLSATVARLSKTNLQIYDQWRSVIVELAELLELKSEDYDKVKGEWLDQFMGIMPAVEALDLVREGRSLQLSKGLASPVQDEPSPPSSPNSPRRAASSAAAKFAAIPSSIPNFYQNASSHIQLHHFHFYYGAQGMFGDPMVSFKHSHHREKLRALYDYDGEQEGDLSFKKGEHITVLDHGTEDDKNWWKGYVNGKEGLFPRNYVESPDRPHEKYRDSDDFKEYVPEGGQPEKEASTSQKQGEQDEPRSALLVSSLHDEDPREQEQSSSGLSEPPELPPRPEQGSSKSESRSEPGERSPTMQSPRLHDGGRSELNETPELPPRTDQGTSTLEPGERSPTLQSPGLNVESSSKQVGGTPEPVRHDETREVQSEEPLTSKLSEMSMSTPDRDDQNKDAKSPKAPTSTHTEEGHGNTNAVEPRVQTIRVVPPESNVTRDIGGEAEATDPEDAKSRIADERKPSVPFDFEESETKKPSAESVEHEKSNKREFIFKEDQEEETSEKKDGRAESLDKPAERDAGGKEPSAASPKPKDDATLNPLQRHNAGDAGDEPASREVPPLSGESQKTLSRVNPGDEVRDEGQLTAENPVGEEKNLGEGKPSPSDQASSKLKGDISPDEPTSDKAAISPTNVGGELEESIHAGSSDRDHPTLPGPAPQTSTDTSDAVGQEADRDDALPSLKDNQDIGDTSSGPKSPMPGSFPGSFPKGDAELL